MQEEKRHGFGKSKDLRSNALPTEMQMVVPLLIFSKPQELVANMSSFFFSKSL